MSRRIEGYIRWLNSMREYRRKTTALIMACSLVVSGNVFWLMRGIGTAMTDVPTCGQEEHEHTDECYETVLVCGFDEDVDPSIHVHTDECYETVLVCGMDEHIHTDECFISGSTHETPAVWEATIPELTGSVREDLVSVALSQTGYMEGEDSYSRYGDWYGNPNGEWNVMFVSFCLNYAGIDSETIPYGSGCWAWQVKLEEQELLKKDDISAVLPGDLILFDSDGDGKCDRTGIVVDVSDVTINTIEGDIEGVVETGNYLMSDTTIYGYVRTCEDVVIQEEETDTEIPEEEDPDIIPEDLIEYVAETESGLIVTVKAPVGAFPEGTVMSASDVDDEAIINQAAETLDEDVELQDAFAVDINFEDPDGNIIEPLEGYSVSVSITIPEEKRLEGDEYQVFHIDDEGVENIADATINDSEVAFTTDGFSIYVITATGTRNKDEVHEGFVQWGINPDNGQYVSNSFSSPYIMEVGDTVILEGRSIYARSQIDGANDVVGIKQGSTYASDGQAEDGSYYFSRREFVALKPGRVELQFNTCSEMGTAHFYIEVIPKYNNDLGGNGKTFDFTWDGSLAAYRDPNNPYILCPGDSFTIVSYRYWSGGGSFFFIDKYGNRISADQTGCLAYVNVVNNGDLINNDFYAYSNSGGNVYGIATWVEGSDRNNPNNWRYMYFVVTDKVSPIDHADIEVADDGTYTSSRIYNSDGKLWKTVTEERSYVCDVNECILYKSSDDSVPVTFYHEVYDPDYRLEVLDGVHGFKHDDYWKDPNQQPGDSQYELTSKYGLDDNGQLVWTDRRFFYDDVDHAMFDVQLELRPISSKTYYWDGSQWVLDESMSVTYSEDESLANKTYIPSAIYYLDRRAVIDAYNKCPNHSGLDFTVRSSSAIIAFEANKVFRGGVLTGDDFTFEVYDPGTDKVISRATNAADGTVKFDNIHFEQEGTYIFVIREVPDSTRDDIVFDTQEYSVTIVVTKNADGVLEPNFSDSDYNSFLNEQYLYEFVNYKQNNQFTLPDTGGTGIAPYLISGVAIIAASLTLLILRRRKEVDL